MMCNDRATSYGCATHMFVAWLVCRHLLICVFFQLGQHCACSQVLVRASFAPAADNLGLLVYKV